MRGHYHNVVIGGGPGGLNMALELSKRSIDYLLLEASETVGGQWDRHPVCGQLISLNKSHVPDDNHTYRMRYDWHTLSSISAEDVANDPKLRFTEWTSEHWPSSKMYKEYLKYVAERMGIMKHVRTGARVKRVSRKDGRFVIEVSNSDVVFADRLFCATGKTRPIIPNIEGLDSSTCTLYGDFDADAAAQRYKNKIVVVLGRGNSAFEIAHHLVDITAETRVVTRSLPLFARQTHNVHDVRAQVADVFDLMQLKSNNNIVSDRIVEISRITNGKHKGRLVVRFETPCVHWSPPRWLKRSSIVDDVIVCCGFSYTLADVLDMETVRPMADEREKYCLLTPSWESVNEPGLYFVGAPMRVNDPDAASGFVHGFRCNIQALGHIIAEKYHGMTLEPVFEYNMPMNTLSEVLMPLAKFFVHLVSNTMPLFEQFSYFGNVVTFEEDAEEPSIVARVWPPFSRQYNHERWGSVPNRIEMVFEYGFSQYGDGNLPTHFFTLPADHFDSSKSAYIHPVFYVFRDGVEAGTFHLQESLIGRWDLDDYVDEETNLDQHNNVAFNACACALGLEERRSTLPVLDSFVGDRYPLMNEYEIAEALRIQPTLALLAKNR
ncbi:pyridine nucleotide-disulfide oxidoreductase [Metarhizium guizhouense ARSEF 977]|uniref:Pyridine nucleotide-disulfide oxidoreductase n=1 Tax=Metarhizium guizhouense (strain ARSEF 977) TaxID=1276136 RepID=A0A0B4HQJ3_METGA|nr:pyridine nucleotide-disulfide oxidoreductase [Metarhizium guizhouense ARSEF 977]